MAREYHRGMSYAEFLEMMEQRRNPDPGNPAPPLEMPCLHPFDWLEKNVRAKRDDRGLMIIVEYKCSACDAELDATRKLLRSK